MIDGPNAQFTEAEQFLSALPNGKRAVSSWYPGTFENYVASIIHDWQQTKDERLKRVTDALYMLGLTRHVSTKKIGDVGIELQARTTRITSPSPRAIHYNQ